MPELDRRNFLKIVGLSAGAAATAACKEPVEKVIPYLNQPEEIIPGIPTYYASTCRECPGGCSIQVKTREGRPLKLDGNPADPGSRGALCVRGQASLARTYDPNRFRGPLKRDGDRLVPISWEEARATLLAQLGPAAEAGKVFFLSGHETGTFDALVDEFMSTIGSPKRLRYELFAYEPLRAANQAVFGRREVPRFVFEASDVIVAFGTDFLETWVDPLAQQVGFSEARRGGQGFAAFIGPRLSLSGANCDVWLAAQPGTEIWVALGLAREVARRKGADLGALSAVLEPHTLESVARKTGLSATQLESLATRIADAEAPLALPPGNELQGANATAFAAAVQILNYVSGAVGKTVVFGPNHRFDNVGGFTELRRLAEQLDAGEIDVLFVHGANPVYHAPQLGFGTRVRKVFTVSFASTNDETTAALADLVLPSHTPFEAWGDSESVAGVRTIQQPTILPIFDTRQTADVLIDLAQGLGKPLPGPASFRERLAAAWPNFDQALATGGSFELAAPVNVELAGDLGSLKFDAVQPAGAEGELMLIVYPSLHFYDGRSANIPVLQETPDPVTKLVWGSYAELHPDTAREMDIAEGDIVTVQTAAGEVRLPAFPHVALRPGIIAIQIGQGHQPVNIDLPADDRDRMQRRKIIGVNALTLLPAQTDEASGALAWLSSRAKVSKTGESKWIAKPQMSFDQEGRGIAQATTLAALAGGAEAGAHGGGATHGGSVAAASHGEAGADGHEAHEAPYADAMHLETVEFDPAKDAINPTYRWGMSIDLDACTGCGACVTACHTENNLFAVGEEQVRFGREMSWIRLERYIETQGDEIEVRHVPMLCQHCGSAPCEPVCPVFATYHNDEGLNVMVPNRCIGTRYCGNNCPYKVRRFNYYSYDWDVETPEELSFNPDVMVRSKGVMEKCTFCVQRINAAKDQARLEGRTVRDGEFTTACAQACPSKAIVFGNHKDPESEVSKRREDPRAYWVFHHLNTRPAVTYQKSIRRNETEEA